MENIIEQIRKFVEDECKKPTSHYGYDIYEFHLISVHNYAKLLVEKLDADKEIVELAAWLHDIGSIIHGRKDHHLTGIEIAEEKLKELNYPVEKIELIKKCILNHRGFVNNKKESIEEQIIADADALATFGNVQGIFKAAFTYENLNQARAREAALRKLKGHWAKLSLKESRELIRKKYEAALVLFGDENEH